MNDPQDLLARFEARGRRLHNSIPLPPEGALTDSQISSVRGALAAFLERHALTQHAAAKQVRGVSAATISQFLSAGYAGDNSKVARALNRWMERQSTALESRGETPFVRTRVASAMSAMIAHTCNLGCMLAVVAPSGIGKSRLIRWAAEERDGVYVYADGDLTASGLTQAIGRAAKIPLSLTGGIGKARAELVAGLRGTDHPIFVDEAHLLRPQLFAGLRSLHDQTGCPMILAGALEILQRVDDSSTGEGQLSSRTLRLNILEEFASVEPGGGTYRDGDHLGDPLFTVEEIEAVLAATPLRFSPTAMEMLTAIASLPSHGCLRTVELMAKTALASFGPDAAISMEALEQLAQTLFGYRSNRLYDMARQQRRTFIQQQQVA